MTQEDDEVNDNNTNDINGYQIVGLDKEDLAIISDALEHYRDSLNIAFADKQMEETGLSRPIEKINRVTEMLSDISSSKTSTIGLINFRKKKQKVEGQRRQREKEKQQPKTITMAEELKYKASLQKKAKLGDGSNIAAEDR
jgi:hypothetical protein